MEQDSYAIQWPMAPGEPQRHLRDMLEKLKLSPTVKGLDELGQLLMEYSPKLRGCGYSYLISVLNGTLEPSLALMEGIIRLGMKLRGTHELTAKAVPRDVWVLPGTITDGAFIMGSEKLCPGCGIKFVSDNPLRAKCPVCSPPRPENRYRSRHEP